MKLKTRKRILVKGIVQGVGFRPFVYRLAQKLSIKGWILNSSAGVTIEAEGNFRQINEFIKKITDEKPANARIDQITAQSLNLKGYKFFTIRESAFAKNGAALLSPDLATCKDCQDEILNVDDRRYRYPFTNCTNCGPRYSIIENAPYDRIRTTMKEFKMCQDCEHEYHSVFDRRFHAQPNACTSCGPELFLFRINQVQVKTDDPIGTTIKYLKEGRIVAIKGLGGFHIACDAKKEKTVKQLRRRKKRLHKPLALMCQLKNIPRIAELSKKETELLLSPQAPIILLHKKNNTILASSLAPGNPYFGIMLPYTPLHHLLLQHFDYLVMTSGNVQDEPIIIDDRTCFTKLHSIVDFVLTNNRPIQNRNDDSILAHSPAIGFSILRRSRGYAPDPIDLASAVKPTLACGGELKGTFCLASKKEAYLSPHLGDMENAETMAVFKKTLKTYINWFKFEPDLVAYDLHPDYLTTRFALSLDRNKKIPIQHHHAHIAACIAENLIEDQVIGLAFDGTGYGFDGKIWGCEFLIGSSRGFQRVGHLKYLPLPGGEASIRHPYRIGLGYLAYIFETLPGLPFMKTVSRQEINVIKNMIDKKFNLVFTSSLGRLFDAVAAILGVINAITFEAQAAMQLEYLATSPTRNFYPATIAREDNFIIDPADILRGIVNDIRKGIALRVIASKFHNSIINFSLEMCKTLRDKYNINRVALSGGAFQNRLLLENLFSVLKKNDFVPITHQKVPCNDGGISLGQVVLANNS